MRGKGKSGRNARVPSATYRLQFNAAFTLGQGAEILDYLKELGVSDCYASPLLQAAPGSTHGYDVCDCAQVNRDLGGEAAFSQFSERLRSLDLGLLLDIVPNHMSTNSCNRWLWDVLEKGRDSEFADFFDIDWKRHDGRILLPILGDHYARVLKSGAIRLNREGGAYSICCPGVNLPVARGTIEKASEDSFVNISRDFRALHRLLRKQHYRLAFWRVAPEEINYRRFFDVNSLIALNVHRPDVFARSQELILRWVDEGTVTGLRVDHPDGLRDPEEYLARVRQRVGKSVYIVVEKILSSGEALPESWPVEGTTGYDFMNRANGLFVDSENAEDLTSIYREFAGFESGFESTVYRGKQLVLERSFSGDLDSLADRVKCLAEQSLDGVDLTRRELRLAMAAIIACLPVYRTYSRNSSRRVSEQDRKAIENAVFCARQRESKTDPAAFDFVLKLLLLQTEGLDPSARKQAREFVLRFQMLTGPAMAKGYEDTALYNYNRLVSLNEVGGDPEVFGISAECFHAHNSAMLDRHPHTLLAAATHDTKRGEDARARISVLSEMPQEWKEALALWRSENGGQKQMVHKGWAPSANDEYLLYQTMIGTWPGGNAGGEYCKRLQEYMTKAIRESKAHTSWTDQDHKYEEATRTFVSRILDQSLSECFLRNFEKFQTKVSFFGRLNSLSQVVLKMTSPGVPDFYQGTELWDFSMVDPDNRRTVDYQKRRELLARVQSVEPDLNDASGAQKLWLIHKVLSFRREHPDLFSDGNYMPGEVSGVKSKHVVSFARVHGNELAAIIVPRLVHGLTGGAEVVCAGSDIWGDASLWFPNLNLASLRDLITGSMVSGSLENGGLQLNISSVLTRWPVAILTNVGVT